MLGMTLHIHCFDRYQVQSANCIRKIILFDGDCTGAWFNGTILPGGVDTQMIMPDGTTSLSARYILEGVDSSGKKARLFIENNGTLEGTRPTIWTDSDELRWLESADLYGQVVFRNGELYIEIHSRE